ncbi:hypothetical protein D9M71_315890 [compost metagenome]
MIAASVCGSSKVSKTCCGAAGITTESLARSAGPPAAAASRFSSGSIPAGRGGSSIPMSVRTFDGVSGRRMSERPRASATAFAMHTGVLILLPSPTPLAPSGVNGDGVSMCRITGSIASGAVGTR